MTKLEEYCVYTSLLTGCWLEGYLLSHNTNEDAKNASVYKMVSRWRNSPEVQDYVRRLGYHKIKQSNGEVFYTNFDIIEEPDEVYQPMTLNWL